MGARQDEQAETADESAAQSTVQVDEPQVSSVLAQEPEWGATGLAVELDDPGDDGPDLSPEWADLLHEEALSASGKEPFVLNGDSAAHIDLSLPPLATTPARPKTPMDETPETTSPPAGEVTLEAEESAFEPAAGPVESAEAPGDDRVHVEGGFVPAIEGAFEDAAEWEHEPPDGAQVSEPQAELHLQAQGSPQAADASIAFEEPTPPAPMHFESYGAVPAGGAYVPAPKEKPEATDTVMRTKLGGLLYQQATVKPSDEVLEPDGPQVPEYLEYVGKEQRRALWDETLELYQVVPEVLSGDENQERALERLQEVQDILLEKPRQFDVAKLKVGQVQALVSWRRNVNRWSNTYGWGIFIYEVAWIVALVLGVLTAELVAQFVTDMVGGVLGIDGLARLWSTMMWGGLGGVIGAFYSLYWHVAKVRDFDKRYTMWYAVQPVIGLLLGALVYLLLGSGFLTAQGVNRQNETVTVSLFPYAVACIVGFRQRCILEMIDRVIQIITPSSRAEQSPVEETNEEEPLDSSE